MDNTMTTQLARLMTQCFAATAATFFVIPVMILASPAQAVVIYVDDDAPPGGDGLSWNTAFKYLRDAFDYADQWQNDVEEIRIAQGLYLPDRTEVTPNGWGQPGVGFDTNFNGLIAGGYAGLGSPDPDARDYDAYETILSGDLEGDDGIGFVNYGENSELLIGFQYGAFVQMDGVTVRSAITGVRGDSIEVANSRFVQNRRAIWAHGEPINVVHATGCHFKENEVGVSASGGASLFDCEFINNKKAMIATESDIFISRCQFVANHNSLDDGPGAAGLAFCWGTIQNSEFIGNHGRFGGAISMWAYSHGWFDGRVINCLFRDNTAEKGGAYYTNGSDGERNMPRFINCVFDNNSATVAGGAIYSIRSDVRLANCTLARNSAPNTGGIYTARSSTLKVFNSILRANHGAAVGGPGARVVQYSNITGGHSGEGNIDAAPRFKDILNGDLRLRHSSPCIDAGRNSKLAADITLDLLSNPRRVNDPNTPNTGVGPGPIVDMGAYEYQRP